MPLLSPVQDTRWPPYSGNGDANISNFVCCVGGRDPKIHEVWIRGDNGSTPEVYTPVQVDVNPWITSAYATK